MAARQDVQDGTGRSEYFPGYGQMRAWGKAAPTNGQQGFAPGCLYQNLTGTTGSAFYINVGTFLSSQWINADSPDGGLVTLAAATTLTATAHSGRTLLLSLSGGFTTSLPAATGSGAIYRFIVAIVSSTGYVITAAGSDVFKGSLQVAKTGTTYDTAGAAEQFLSTTNQNITLNGTTKGGLNIGDWILVQDILSGVWAPQGMLTGSGTLATMFS